MPEIPGMVDICQKVTQWQKPKALGCRYGMSGLEIRNKKIKYFRQVHASSAQLPNTSFLVVERMRTPARYTRTKNACGKHSLFLS